MSGSATRHTVEREINVLDAALDIVRPDVDATTSRLNLSAASAPSTSTDMLERTRQRVLQSLNGGFLRENAGASSAATEAVPLCVCVVWCQHY